MSPMSLFAVQASKQALQHAGLDAAAIPANPRFGCIVGSTTGSSEALASTYELLIDKKDYASLSAGDFFRCVSHTAALNVAQCLGIKGFISATSAACASGLQAVGAAYDQIRLGRQDIVLCGGAEELHATTVGPFDLLYAASCKFNDSPERTPRPFDIDRDGLVAGEGAGMIVVENYDHAVRRGAKILAEITGYHTCSNGTHVSQSDESSMVTCMKTTLEMAELSPADIGYVSAHATGTTQGDTAEARAIAAVFGSDIPISSLKGNMGHTLGASGPIELAATLEMMQSRTLFPTHNLDNIDPACAAVRHVQKNTPHKFTHFLKNSFAFGGINAAIACSALP
jgi:3-oxoacyl-[acyl-carrier-protein] synthase II